MSLGLERERSPFRTASVRVETASVDLLQNGRRRDDVPERHDVRRDLGSCDVPTGSSRGRPTGSIGREFVARERILGAVPREEHPERRETSRNRLLSYGKRRTRAGASVSTKKRDVRNRHRVRFQKRGCAFELLDGFVETCRAISRGCGKPKRNRSERDERRNGGIGGEGSEIEEAFEELQRRRHLVATVAAFGDPDVCHVHRFDSRPSLRLPERRREPTNPYFLHRFYDDLFARSTLDRCGRLHLSRIVRIDSSIECP